METQRPGKRQRGFLLALDQIGAGLGMLPLPESVADRPDTPADAIARLDHCHGRVPLLERPRGGEAGKASTRNDHSHVVETGHPS